LGTTNNPNIAAGGKGGAGGDGVLTGGAGGRGGDADSLLADATDVQGLAVGGAGGAGGKASGLLGVVGVGGSGGNGGDAYAYDLTTPGVGGAGGDALLPVKGNNGSTGTPAVTLDVVISILQFLFVLPH
jgi:hypothetical protein